MNATQPLRRKRQSPRHFTATCGAGLEDLVKKEILEFGGKEISVQPGAVSWSSSRLETAYRACLWSRCASRILLTLAEFEAADTDALYARARSMDWEAHFGADATFAVNTTLSKSKLNHSQFASLRIKDGVADWFMEHLGRRPDVDPRQAAIRLNLHVHETKALLSLDLSGDSLHLRGYRQSGTTAPLKESLAAAIVLLAGWNRDFPADGVLLDPMCGSGTLLIEAALIYGDSAPGLARKRFGFQAWRRHDTQLWQRLLDEAIAREDAGMERPWPQYIGYDADPGAVAAARLNIAAAGLKDRIIIKQRQLAALECPHKQGLLLTNPPYGERLSEREAVKYLYRCLGRKLKEKFTGWRFGFFTANPDLADMPGLVWEKRVKLYNGPLPCSLFTTLVEKNSDEPAQHGLPWRIPDHNELDNDFANRLRKNCKSLFPWAAERDIHCFRLYDADMPEYNLVVDLYEQWVHVQEYAPPAGVDPARAKERLQTALEAIRQLLDLPRNRLFIKTRQPQKGKEQYQKRGESGRLYEVREGAARFLVNFTDYLDTGLFLDHRKTRFRLAALAKGKTFLNIFGYTGSATVHAALGGAVATVTVDISSPYLTRAQANMALNGFGGTQHRFEQADSLTWLKGRKERFGLIFVDPPTFSNNRHKQTSFDVQRDHSELLQLAMQHLSHDGLLVFSSNYKKFHLDPVISADFAVEEITGETLPRDFRKTIHRCWELRHRNESPS